MILVDLAGGWRYLRPGSPRESIEHCLGGGNSMNGRSCGDQSRSASAATNDCFHNGASLPSFLVDEAGSREQSTRWPAPPPTRHRRRQAAWLPRLPGRVRPISGNREIADIEGLIEGWWTAILGTKFGPSSFFSVNFRFLPCDHWRVWVSRLSGYRHIELSSIINHASLRCGCGRRYYTPDFSWKSTDTVDIWTWPAYSILILSTTVRTRDRQDFGVHMWPSVGTSPPPLQAASPALDPTAETVVIGAGNGQMRIYQQEIARQDNILFGSLVSADSRGLKPPDVGLATPVGTPGQRSLRYRKSTFGFCCPRGQPHTQNWLFMSGDRTTTRFTPDGPWLRLYLPLSVPPTTHHEHTSPLPHLVGTRLDSWAVGHHRSSLCGTHDSDDTAAKLPVLLSRPPSMDHVLPQVPWSPSTFVLHIVHDPSRSQV
ncbi:hypothetical protein B0T21DRAFT_345275 [Apiosordaria backusii]|uniref:Uncharacterized protein n=1 Tax=Apiosordaria backusii TaxID=314023 RepID=A0AA40K429_9PEZI|nr:hypothetical protein B0T21DRAFT_345275 [Apiosordaria backusii]